METSPPPLTSSPHSSPDTFRSESPILHYAQPNLGGDYQGIKPLYELPFAAASSIMDGQNSLPPLDSTTSAPGWTSSTVLQPLPSLSLTNSLPAGYQNLAHYEHGMSGPYSHDMYTPQQSQGPVISSHNAMVGTPCRSPDSVGRRDGSYPRMASPIPRIKADGMSEYARSVAVSQYPSPRSTHSVPTGSSGYPYEPVTTSYVTDLPPAGWSRSEYLPLEPEQQSHSSSSSFGPGTVLDRQQMKAQQRVQRKQRKLTSKEEANFQCEVKGCGKLFSRSYNFKAHMETHDEKREYPFPCTVPDCTKKFVRKTDLQRHNQSVHMKERNHRCDYCGRMFARKDTLRRHMEDGCSKRFDIGTLDLRNQGHDFYGSGAKHIDSSGAHFAPPPPHLPSLSKTPAGSNIFLTHAPPFSTGR